MGQRIEIPELRGRTVVVADRAPEMRSAIRRLLAGNQIDWCEVASAPELATALYSAKPVLIIGELPLFGRGQVLVGRARAVGAAVALLSDAAEPVGEKCRGLIQVDRLYLADRLAAAVRAVLDEVAGA